MSIDATEISAMQAWSHRLPEGDAAGNLAQIALHDLNLAQHAESLFIYGIHSLKATVFHLMLFLQQCPWLDETSGSCQCPYTTVL